MDKQELDRKTTDIAKTLLSYCAARTSDHFEAEDLAQTIILEIYKSADSLRDEKAFYGFMWAVAGNVYKGWCRDKAKHRVGALSEQIPYEEELPGDADDSLYPLRRELTLLKEKYRKAVILYYIKQMSCPQIAHSLSISESMVKYLLFKSRQILKEGMSMERNYGSQSYDPKELSLLFWGQAAPRYYHLADSRIAQNILFACYHDKLSAEQISLEIGVALPYMEDTLKALYESGLLYKDGHRYYTNIVIFTADLIGEVTVKTSALRQRIADLLQKATDGLEERIRHICFVGADMSGHTYRWQTISRILYSALVEHLLSKEALTYPKWPDGTECFIWGMEKGVSDGRSTRLEVGIADMANAAGDRVQFTDFSLNGEMVHHHLFSRQEAANVFLAIAGESAGTLSENDQAIAAEMVRRGYVLSGDDRLRVNVPVFTADQHRELVELLAPVAKQIAGEAAALKEIVVRIIKDHVPVHLKKQAQDMAAFRLFEDAVAAPVWLLYEQNYLLPWRGEGLLPTTYVVLNK